MATNAAQLVARLKAAAGSERLPAADFIALVGDTFRHAGLSAADADIAAEVAAYGTLHGSDAHGAVQMPLYVTGLLDGTIKSAPDVKSTHNLPCCMVMDADNALGLVISRHAIDAAIDLAKTSVSAPSPCATAVISAAPATTRTAPPGRG